MSASSATVGDPLQSDALEVSSGNALQRSGDPEPICFPVTQRDPNDIRTILRLVTLSLIFVLLSLVLAGLLTYRLLRQPELIVVERTPEGDRVVGDDRHHSLQGSVQIRTDAPGDGDKKYLVSKWAESFFQIDPQTRRNDIIRGLKLMTPDAAVALVEQVKQSGEWETQRREEWQSVWKVQVITVSNDDPYKLQIVGQQEISKTIAGVVQHARRQLICTLALRPDPAKRTEENQNTGFRIAGLVDIKVLDDNAVSTAGNSTVNTPTLSVAPPRQ